ncbi:MAG: helix-turn-helix domain-containing protein [Rubrivivax sp.]
MPREHHPTAEAAAASRSLPLLADPLNPLAEQVGKEVAAEVKNIARPAPKGGKKAHAAVLGDLESVALEAHITVLVAKALDRSLNAPTAEGKALRMALIAKLATAEIGEAAAAEAKPASAHAAAADLLLTTAEAAAKLEVSRPHVSMLCDQGKLGEVVMTEGGHRRIRASAVEAYLTARTRKLEGARSPREAAVDAGLYDFPEGHFKNIVRENPGAGKPAKLAAKAARKPRS